MKLKKWHQFITESISNRNFWKQSKEDILEYFLEFLDNGYEIEISLGFYDEKNDCYTEKIYSGDVYPTYLIEINAKNVSKEDLTDTLKFAIDIIEDQANATCRLEDYEGLIDREEIIIKGGFLLDAEDGGQLTLINDTIYIMAIENDPVHISEKELAEYYEWGNVIVDSKSNIYTEIDIEDMSDILLSRNSDYKDVLTKGSEVLWQYYKSPNYEPDINSLFNYLNKENIQLLIKSTIKELGFENFIEECDNPELKDKSEEEAINYLQKESYNKTILKILKSSDIADEIRHIISDYESSAHLYQNYNEIIKEFDSIVNNNFPDNTKIVKKEKKAYTSTDKEGNKTKHEYEEDVDYYRLAYQNDWIENIDEPNCFSSLEGVFKEYAWALNYNYVLNPRFSYCGDVDEASMNKDITLYLKKLLNN